MTPPWFKMAFLGFVAVFVPAYAPQHGLVNLLWFSNVALIGGLLVALFESHPLASMMPLAVALLEIGRLLAETWRRRVDEIAGRGQRVLAVFLNGEALATPGLNGERIIDDRFFLLFNAHHESLPFVLPGSQWAHRWLKELDTATGWRKRNVVIDAGAELSVEPRSLVVLRHAS